MPAPSPLQVSISSLNRLLKEEKSYHKELESQEKRIKTLESSTDDDDGNREFTLKQEKQALQETKKVFPSMEERIERAEEDLREKLEVSGFSETEKARAEEVLKTAEARK